MKSNGSPSRNPKSPGFRPIRPQDEVSESDNISIALPERGGGGGQKKSRKGGGGTKGGIGDAGGAPPTLIVKVLWQSALPVKQALLKRKFGDGVGTSEEARKMLSQPDDVYIMVLEDLPARMAQMGQRLQYIVLQNTSLKRKDKPNTSPTEVQIGTAPNRTTILFMVFPRKDAIILEDKEVEFVCKIANLELHRKFKLADMMYQRKLEL